MKKLFCLLFVLPCSIINAQELPRILVGGITIHSGYNLPFYQALDYIIENKVNALDISLGIQADGRNHWENSFNNPRTGFGYSYWRLGNDEILGSAHALYAFMNTPVKRLRRFSLNIQCSAGAAYLPQKFDINENHLNRAIGSHMNVFIRLGADARFRIVPNGELTLGAGFSHFSNGKTASPNYGINTGTVSAGMSFIFKSGGISAFIPEPEEKIRPLSKYTRSINLSAGTKVYDNLLNKKYVSSSATFNIEKNFNYVSHAGLGMVLFYDSSIREALEVEKGTADSDITSLIRLGAHISYTCRYRNFIAGIQVGHYLYSKYKVMTNIYNRISVQYLLNENMAFSAAVKSHLGKADCLEYGLTFLW
jgi:hypothetical protein